MKDCPDLDDKTGHDYDRSQCEAKESKAVLLTVDRHNDEADDQRNESEDHQLIILLAKGEFMFHVLKFQYKSSSDILRYLLMEKKVLKVATIIPVTRRKPSKIRK